MIFPTISEIHEEKILLQKKGRDKNLVCTSDRLGLITKDFPPKKEKED
jgi:hypothetical protein